MADNPDFFIATQPTLIQLIDYFYEKLRDPATQKALSHSISDGAAKAQASAGAAESVSTTFIAPAALKLLGPLHDVVEKALAPFLTAIVADLIGVEVPKEALKAGPGKAGVSQVGDALATLLFRAIRGDGAEIQPGDEGARRLVSFGAEMVVQPWFEGIILDIAADFMPGIDSAKEFAELGEELVGALGLGRLMRTALRPLVRTFCATPLEWQVNKSLRPTLLTGTTAARQFIRGTWTKEQVTEELARAGYSDDRIAALITDARRFLGESDVQILVLHGAWTEDEGFDYLRLAGYTEDDARAALHVGEARDADQMFKSATTQALSAYADGRIDRALLEQILSNIIDLEPRRNLFLVEADARRLAAQQPLSPSEAKSLVKDGILAVPDYRAALERANYTPDAVDALELQLRKELDDQAKIEDLRAQQAADKAAAAKAKAAAAAAKQQAADAAAALAKRGSISDLTRAYVRGLIPLARLQEVLTAHYDADTVRILSELAEQQRAAYVAQQQQAADAAKRAAARGLSLSQLQTAVVDGILTLDQFRARLTQQGVAGDDVDVLATETADKKADHDRAVQLRADADQKAKAKSISLSQFEQLVRRGAKSMDDYDALLVSLGYDDASRADLEQLLQLKIADDQQAAQLRAAAAAAPPAKGVSLAQMRQAVILGLQSLDDFQTYLVDHDYTADAQVILVGELRDDVDEADAARQRRSTATATTGARALPLATVERAARLGLIPIVTYEQRLADAGYSADDIAIEMDLLTTEIADARAADQTAAATAAPSAGKGLTLADVARAVKHGVQTLDDYRAAAAAAGLAPDAVNTLVRVLGDELATTADAKARRDEIAGKLAPTSTPIGVLEDQVRAGTLTVNGYVQTLEQEGIAPDDAALLGGLLVDELDNGGAPAGA